MDSVTVAVQQIREALVDLVDAVDSVCDSDALASTLQPSARSALELSLQRARVILADSNWCERTTADQPASVRRVAEESASATRLADPNWCNRQVRRFWCWFTGRCPYCGKPIRR